jgi:cytochrome c553
MAILSRLRIAAAYRTRRDVRVQPSSLAESSMTRPSPIACLILSFAVLPAAVAQSPAPTNAPAPAAPAASSPAPAAANTQPAAQGDAARGRALTYTCHGCHGVTGYRNAYPNYHVPRIGGQSQQYLLNALTEYRKGTRKHPTMQAQAQSFSEQDIADIAAYLSGLKP